jgi:hypothetical protein
LLREVCGTDAYTEERRMRMRMRKTRGTNWWKREEGLLARSFPRLLPLESLRLASASSVYCLRGARRVKG